MDVFHDFWIEQAYNQKIVTVIEMNFLFVSLDI